MTTNNNRYCLDSNVLIQAWRTYYSQDLCPDYWKILNQLGRERILFIPQEVLDEINKTEDDLTEWLNSSEIPVANTTEDVTLCVREIFERDPSHKRLVDSIKQRSMADPWIIAHAMNAQATVVTQEQMNTSKRPERIKIPNVCKNMGVHCIDDFQLVRELNIRFQCRRATG